MHAGPRSPTPRWLVVVIVIIGALGIVAAVHRYIESGGTSRSSPLSDLPGFGKGTGGKGGAGASGGAPGTSLSTATIQGTARSVETAGTIHLDTLTVDMGTAMWRLTSGDGDVVQGTGMVTVQGGADGIVASVFRTLVTPTTATFAARVGAIDLPDGATVNGTAVHGSHPALELGYDAHPWLDAPESMVFDTVDEFSWAGSGDVAVAEQHLSGDYLGAMGSLSVTLTRTADAVQLSATGGVQQVFVDGQPAFDTTATIERVRADVTVHAGDPNQTSYVTWAPTDTGQYGMCILRVVPRSGHVEWVNVGLQHMPPMFGGEQHSPVGGDTSGLGDSGRFFGGPDAIDSFIRVGDADRRDLSLSIPVGTPPGVYTIEIAIEGNFEPVVFSMTITVAA